MMYRPKADWRQWAWGSEFLFECFPWRYKKNVAKMLQIASFSRDTLRALRETHHHEYQALANGILTYYRTDSGLKHGATAAQTAQHAGVRREIKNKDECFSLEPKLRRSEFEIKGGDYTQDDESGDAYESTKLIAKESEALGVKFFKPPSSRRHSKR